MKINENPLILAQVTYPGWLAAGRSRGARGGGIGAWGRPRRPRGQKHVRNVVSDVRTDSYGDWRAQTQFLENRPKLYISQQK